MENSRNDDINYPATARCCECGRVLSGAYIEEADSSYYQIDGLVLCNECARDYITRNCLIWGTPDENAGGRCCMCGEVVDSINGFLINEEYVDEWCLTDYLDEKCKVRL